MGAGGSSNCGAYDNFDCINECIDEEPASSHHTTHKSTTASGSSSTSKSSQSSDEQDQDEEDDDEKCCFVTSNLVEDGFIRMSSPVERQLNEDDDAGNVELGGPKVGNEDVENDVEDTEKSGETSDTRATGVGSNEFSSSNRMSREFPNVGSSPVMHEHENVAGLVDSSSDDDDDDDDNDVSDATQSGEQVAEKALEVNYDGIVMIEKHAKDENSLSDNDDLLINDDDDDEEEDGILDDDDDNDDDDDDDYDDEKEQEMIEDVQGGIVERKIKDELEETDQDQDSTLNTNNDSQEEANSSPSSGKLIVSI